MAPHYGQIWHGTNYLPANTAVVPGSATLLYYARFAPGNEGKMRGLGGTGGFRLFARLFALSAGCLALANCSSSHFGAGNVDPKYGVSSSARVIEPGQPVPKGGGVYRVGKPYVVGGREYVPHEDANYSAEGLASWYGDDFHGRYTANGEIFDMNSISAAHPTMPLPSYARVTNLSNHRSIIVRVNDRGPYVGNRLIDVSVKTAKLLGFYGHGLTKVKVDYVGRAPLAGSDDRMLMASLREHVPATEPPVRVASSKPYAPVYFDAHPMTKLPARTRVPIERPYTVDQQPREAAVAPPVRTVELAAATRPLRGSAGDAGSPGTPSPVSAFAAEGYDARAGFMSGRGLY
jgi:rare lipoprotein A